MNITKTQADGKTTFAINGRLDTVSSPQLQDALLAAIKEARFVELNFADVLYISSAGLRVLLLGEKNAKIEDCVMSIINVRPEVMEIFELTGFSDILKIA